MLESRAYSSVKPVLLAVGLSDGVPQYQSRVALPKETKMRNGKWDVGLISKIVSS